MTPRAGPLGYAAMRRLWCRQALWGLARRWGVYALVVMALVGAGISGGGQVIAALAAATVLPLFRALAASWAAGALVLVLQAVAGAGVVWALRPLLLPQRWLEAERALPIPGPVCRRSDAMLVGLALLPLLALYAGGAASVLGADPAWLRPRAAAALVALLGAATGSVALGVLLLQWRRRPPHHRFATAPAGRRGGARPWPVVLLWLPLRRGPARRLGAVLGAGTLLLGLPLAGLVRWPQGGGWWLAALAGAGWLLATRAASLVHQDLLPLLAETTMLPLPPRRLRRSATLLPVLPLLPAHALLPWLLPPARPAVLLPFVLAALGTAATLAAWPPVDPETHAARWLLALVLLLALASEVLR